MKKITSVNNEYIKKIASLKLKKYREEYRLFFVEGYHLVKEARKANILMEVLIVDEKDYLEGFNNLLVTEEIIKKIANTVSPQNIIGICKIEEEKFEFGEKILVLDDLQDPGNLGTLVRTALGFGFTNIILSTNSIDIYNDKFLRATQGAFFKTNIITGNLEEWILKLKEKGYYVIGTGLINSKDIEDVGFPKNIVLILGNEGSGIKKEILNICDVVAKISINEDLESLNVMVAGGILMYMIASKTKF
ncbi:MAG TPA: RNA methyltransferase [Acholeplasmataceae bacterium]|nr:RNA methyltransferase [Acholeplasmataceae bacterium]